jgi:hypothetical protein
MCENEETIRINMACLCTGDDWECYKPAQLQLLHLLSRTSGCVTILTGDMHFSDIKVTLLNSHICGRRELRFNIEYLC